MPRLLILLAALLLPACAEAAEPDWDRQREAMVRGLAGTGHVAQLREHRSIGPRVLRAMRLVPRHELVPEDVRLHSYEDRPLPIGHDATISQPYVVALMTELLDVRREHRVLEIGTGSGYQAAILSMLAERVFTIEIVEPLAARAAADLERLGYANVTVHAGDGYLGWPEEAPFDRIIVTAAAPHIPEPLVEQLRPGGRMVIPVSRGRYEEELMLVEKGPGGRVRSRPMLPVRFVPLQRAQE